MHGAARCGQPDSTGALWEEFLQCEKNQMRVASGILGAFEERIPAGLSSDVEKWRRADVVASVLLSSASIQKLIVGRLIKYSYPRSSPSLEGLHMS